MSTTAALCGRSGLLISIVCVYNNERILKEDLLDSLENQTSEHELILIDNTQGQLKSAAEAFNRGGAKSKGQYIMFVHQDVHLCSNSWLETTEKLLDSIPNLGIAGTAGARRSKPPRMVEAVTNIKHGIPPMNVPLAVPLREPVKVQTLDESLVIIPRPVFDILHFDEKVCDDWHLYAAEYSLSVARLGFDVYVIPAFIHHRSIGKFNEHLLQVISSWGAFPAGYYRTLGKLLKKHRSYTRHVYTNCGWWNTSYPSLTLSRAREVLRISYHGILRAAYYKALRLIITTGIISRLRNAFRRIVFAIKPPPSAVWHSPDSDVQKLDRTRIASMYMQGEGIQIGGFHDPLEVPPGVRVRYVDLVPEDRLRQQYPSLNDTPSIRVDLVDDVQKLSSIVNDSQDFVIATSVLQHFDNPLLALQNMLRVVKRCGVIFLYVDGPVPPLEPIFRGYNGQPDRFRKADFEERSRLSAKGKDKEGTKLRAEELRKQEILELLSAIKLWMNLPFFVELIQCVGGEFIVILRKSPQGTP